MSASDIDGDAAGNLAVPGGNFGQPSYSERCRKMGKLIRASVLTLLFACSASAGIMTHGVYDPPPPPPPTQLQSDGVMVNGSPQSQPSQEATAEELAEASLVQIALNLLALL
jgi:hypothetical protein